LRSRSLSERSPLPCALAGSLGREELRLTLWSVARVPKKGGLVGTVSLALLLRLRSS
jgi:hypothetical protein